MKKIIAVLLSALLAVSLAACGGRDEKEDNVNSQSKIQSESIAEPEDEKDSSESEPAESEKSAEGETVDGMRVEFKEAMDAYENFYNDYIDFLKNMDKDNPGAVLSEYLEMLNKLTEYDEKFDEWEDEDLNDAELKYYLEVNSRVLQKLSEVSD